MTSTPAVEVRNLRMAFGSRTIMRDLAFDVQRGEVFFIGGNSGSGKSTLFKHIVGLYRPAEGEIHIGGENAGSTDRPRARSTSAGRMPSASRAGPAAVSCGGSASATREVPCSAP
jgi:ABC-type transporter Mla maintaining outer membrane lipid asymmetry ATPase subunit MlaF